MLRHFRLSKVSMGITMVLVLLSGILVGSFLLMIQANAESTSPVIVGKNLQVTFSATNSQQQTDWQVKFQANPQLAAARFKLEVGNQAITKIQQANQEIPADKDDYFELTKDQLQNATFTAAKNQDVKVTLATKNETETAFSPEGNGTFTISASTAGAVDESLEETPDLPVDTTESTIGENDSTSSTVMEETNSSTVSSDAQTNSASTSTEESTEEASSSATATSVKGIQGVSASLNLVQGTATGTGLSKINEGAIELAGVFATPNGSGITTQKGPADSNGGVPYDEVIFAGQHVRSSIFANDKLDFSKSFNGRTFINFGTGGTDGLAFVIQNEKEHTDVRGRFHKGETQALTTATQDTDGQNLGVAGGGAFDYDYPLAIQNSFAVGFDMFSDVSHDENFDADPLYNSANDLPTPHMAYTFPADPASYKYPQSPPDGSGLVNKQNRSTLVHHNTQLLNGAVSSTIEDNTWYEFRFTYNASTKVFSYFLRNPNNNLVTTAVNISLADLTSHLDLTNNANQAYWGFTSSNGSSAGSVKIAFSKLPDNTSLTLANNALDASDKSVVTTANDTTKTSYITAGTQGKLIGNFEYSAGDYNLALDKFEFQTDPTVITTSDIKGITMKVNGVALDSSLVKYTASADGKITVSTTSPNILKVADKVQVIVQMSPSTKLTGDKLTSFTSKVSLYKEDDNTITKEFSSDPTYFWVKVNTAVKIVFKDTLSHSLKTVDSEVKSGSSVDISSQINTAFTSSGLKAYKALGANNSGQVRKYAGSYVIKDPTQYTNYATTGKGEIIVTLLSPISFTFSLSPQNVGNSIPDVIGWGNKTGFETADGIAGMQSTEFIKSSNALTGETSKNLVVSYYANDVTVYGLEGDTFDLTKFSFLYPVLKGYTTVNGNHVIAKIANNTPLSSSQWRFNGNTGNAQTKSSLTTSGILSAGLMWYTDTSTDTEKSMILIPAADSEIQKTYDSLGLTPKWNLQLQGPKKLTFTVHLPDGSTFNSQNDVYQYPPHTQKAYPDYQTLWGIEGSATNIDDLVTEYVNKLHTKYPASTFTLTSKSKTDVANNQSFSSTASKNIDLYFVSATSSLKGQFVDQDGNLITKLGTSGKDEFVVKTNTDGTVEFSWKSDMPSNIKVPFDTEADDNVNLDNLLTKSGVYIPKGYILADDASFEYQLAENPNAIAIKLIKVDVPNTGINSSNQNMTIVLVVTSSLVGIGFYLYKRRQGI